MAGLYGVGYFHIGSDIKGALAAVVSTTYDQHITDRKTAGST